MVRCAQCAGCAGVLVFLVQDIAAAVILKGVGFIDHPIVDANQLSQTVIYIADGLPIIGNGGNISPVIVGIA